MGGLRVGRPHFVYPYILYRLVRVIVDLTRQLDRVVDYVGRQKV